MKKYFFLAILVTMLVAISCSKPDDDPIIPPPPPPPPVELAPTVELSIVPNDAIIPYNTNVTISWTSTNAKTVSLNGEQVGTSGSKTINKMIVTTTFTALATNVTKTATVEKTVTIGEEPTPTATLTISPNDAVLPYGNSVTVTWNITNFKTATFNGEAITTATGSKEFKKLLINTDFVIIATNFTKSVTIKKTVVVGDWSTSVFGKISHGYWHNTQSYMYVHTPSGDITYTVIFDDVFLARQYYFNIDGILVIKAPDGTIIGAGGVNTTWILNNDFTIITYGGTSIYKIIEISTTKFVFSREIIYDNFPATSWEVYTR